MKNLILAALVVAATFSGAFSVKAWETESDSGSYDLGSYAQVEELYTLDDYEECEVLCRI